MSHSQGHAGCQHHSAAGLSENRLKLSLLLTLAFVVVELAAGIRAGSLALVSDAGHNFTDGLALALSWYAIWIARKPATPTRTYGYHRVGILTALFNAVTLMVIAVLIFREGCLLLQHPHPVSGGPMIVVAGIGFFMNTVIALSLWSQAAHNVNVRSAFIHMVGDALSSVGVVAAGVLIHFTGWSLADPIMSLLIGMFIAYTSWGIVGETLNVLLEGTPRGLDVAAMAGDMREVPGVADVHDLHVWTIADGMNAMSCHLLVAEPDLTRAFRVVREVKAMLSHRYAVGHATIETECGGCETEALHCHLSAMHAPHLPHEGACRH